MTDNNNELWEVINDFPMYEVSSLGRVKSHYSGKILKPFFIWTGYLMINLWKDGKINHKLVHRLVGQAFIDNPDNLPCCDHIDGDKTNNRVSNLRWCSRKENSNYDNHKPMPEEIKTKFRKSYYRNRESRIEQVKHYRESHKEQVLEKMKKYYQAHKEQLLEYRKQYYQQNKENWLKYRQNNKRQQKQ